MSSVLAFYGKRLPTEVEWEAAARGPNGRMYAFGDEFDASQANVGRTPYARAYEPVRSRGGPGSGWVHGLFHTTGNAREWTADRYLAYPGFRRPPPDERLNVPIPVFERRHRVSRGGYFGANALLSRSTFRFGFTPKLYIYTGARGVRRKR